MKRTRVFFENDTTLIDITDNVRRFNVGTYTLPFVAAEDRLYIGNIAPFNHFFAECSVLNTTPSIMSIEYWDGSSWRATVELVDLTNGLISNNWVEFVPDRDHGWDSEDTDNAEVVMGLTSLTIYDLYWIRISFDTDLDAGTTIKWIGQKFSDDNDLTTEYKDLMRAAVLDRFESGKTNWDEQHVQAALYIQRDLIKRNILWAPGQILSRDQFALASIHKVAEIIYKQFGDDYADQRKQAESDYTKSLDLGQFPVDTDGDGVLDISEQNIKSGILRRE